MLQAATAFAHVYQTIVVVGHVAHHFCGSADNATEILQEIDILDSVRCFQGKLIGVAFVVKQLLIEVAQQERRVVEHVEIACREGQPIVGMGLQSRADVLPCIWHLENDGHGMLDLPVYMHKNTCRSNEGHIAFHAARGHVAPVGIDTVADGGSTIGWQTDAPTIHALLAP